MSLWETRLSSIVSGLNCFMIVYFDHWIIFDKCLTDVNKRVLEIFSRILAVILGKHASVKGEDV